MEKKSRKFFQKKKFENIFLNCSDILPPLLIVATPAPDRAVEPCFLNAYVNLVIDRGPIRARSSLAVVMAVVYVINKMEVDMTNSNLNITDYQVMRSNAGWYVGRGCFPYSHMPALEQPYDRLSEYFGSASEAQEWLINYECHTFEWRWDNSPEEAL